MVPPNGSSDWSHELHSFLSNAVGESELSCHFADKEKDEHGRVVYSIERLVMKDGQDVQKLLVEKGFATVAGRAPVVETPEPKSAPTPPPTIKAFQVLLREIF